MEGTKKSIVVVTLTVVFSVLLSIAVAATSFACSMDEINTLFDSLQAAAKVADTATLSGLLSPSYTQVWVDTTGTSPEVLVNSYTQWLNTASGQTYSHYTIFNREILEQLTGDKVLVSSEIFVVSTADHTSRYRIIHHRAGKRSVRYFYAHTQ